MKQLCRVFFVALAAGIVLTQLTLAVSRAAGFTAALAFPTPEFIYLGVVLVFVTVQTIMLHPPQFPSFTLTRLLETEGYSESFYAVVFGWYDRCAAYGGECRIRAELACAELLIDGGHYGEGFKRLESLDFSSLEPRQKRVYYNTCLYGAVLCGDAESAERIYNSGRSYLLSVSEPPLSASVKHTLGCFEYSRGNKELAERLFMQALENARADDVLCEIWLSLTVCYLDSGRERYAAEALKTAAECAYTVPLKAKVARARELMPTAPPTPYPTPSA